MEIELKGGPFAKAIRVYLNFSSILSHKSFTNCQTESNPVFIEPIVTVFQFAEGLKKLFLIFFGDSNSVIANLDD